MLNVENVQKRLGRGPCAQIMSPKSLVCSHWLFGISTKKAKLESESSHKLAEISSKTLTVPGWVGGSCPAAWFKGLTYCGVLGNKGGNIVPI